MGRSASVLNIAPHSTHIDNIINTTTNPVVALVVTGCTISSEVVSGVDIEIDIHESLVRTPYRSCHRWPWSFEYQYTYEVSADISDIAHPEEVPSTSFPTISSPDTGSTSAASMPKNGRQADPGFVGVTPARGVRAWEPVSVWKYVCLLVSAFLLFIGCKKNDTYVNNMRLLPADDVVVPLPHLGCNWFADGAKHTKRVHWLHPLIPSPLQQTKSSWCNVEVCDIVLQADIPVPAGVGVGWCAFVDHGADAKKKWRVHKVSVTSDPAYVSTTEEDVSVVNVENVFATRSCSEQISCKRNSSQQMFHTCVHHSCIPPVVCTSPFGFPVDPEV
jgi:hypothetical protein